MIRKRYTEEQIIAVFKDAQADVSVRPAGHWSTVQVFHDDQSLLEGSAGD